MGNAINKYSDIEARIIGLETEFVKDFGCYVTFNVNKLLLAGDPADILKLEKLFSEKYKGVIGVFRSEEFFGACSTWYR